MVVKEIDITKLKPFDWRWVVGLLVAVVVLLAVWGAGNWIFKTVRGYAQPKAEDLGLPD